jgi:formylmethanofuran dehydrogenase subunit B
MIPEMSRAFVAGRPVALADAIAEAARLLSESRLPVIAGLDCDVLGAREAVALARRLGGVCAQDDSISMQSTLAAMREAGALVTTPNEARLRADTWLMVGSVLAVDWPDIVERVVPGSALKGDRNERRMVWLCPDDRGRTGDTARQYGRVLGRSVAELPALLAALRARIAGRAVNASSASLRKRERLDAIDTLAAELKAATFGVAVWSPRDLDALATEMLFGLVDDLNAQTRFAAVPVPRNGRSPCAVQVCGWLTGYPPPVGFGRGVPEHDPWRFEALRLIQSGEADCALLISVSGIPELSEIVPLILIGSHHVRRAIGPMRAARVQIDVGHPGIDHDGLLWDIDVGTIVPETASRPSDLPAVADILARIAAALPEHAPC